MKSVIFTLLLFSFSSVGLLSQTKDTIYVVQKDTVYYVPTSAKSVDRVKAELGIALGTPSGLNLILAAHTNDVLFKISGSYLGNSLFGGQFDIGYKISEFNETYHGIGLGFGFARLTTTEEESYGWDYYEVRTRHHWEYVSLNYMLNTFGFYFNAGLSVGSGSFSNPQLMVQIGYAYQFR
jgi:hypothetical protein